MRTTEFRELVANVAVCPPVHGTGVARAVVGRCYHAVLIVVIIKER